MRALFAPEKGRRTSGTVPCFAGLSLRRTDDPSLEHTYFGAGHRLLCSRWCIFIHYAADSGLDRQEGAAQAGPTLGNFAAAVSVAGTFRGAGDPAGAGETAERVSDRNGTLLRRRGRFYYSGSVEADRR